MSTQGKEPKTRELSPIRMKESLKVFPICHGFVLRNDESAYSGFLIEASSSPSANTEHPAGLIVVSASAARRLTPAQKTGACPSRSDTPD
jgi:hypothetical protein